MSRVTPLQPAFRNEIRLGDTRRLRVGEAAGRGNAATVYRAILESGSQIEKTVALKVFDVVSSDEREVVFPRLTTMARHGACVQHPNVAQVYEYGVFRSAQPYLISEWVQGQSLAMLMDAFAQAKQRMPLDLGLFIATEIAEALFGAALASAPDGRQLGIVHGELSAREVLLSWFGEVKVTDFGLARAVCSASTVRRVALMARRAATLAPETVEGAPVDARSDVFSLGILLHETLSGPRFPAGMPEVELLDRAREGYVHLSLFGPQLPAEVDAILKRATHPDPRERFSHAGAFAYELRRVAMAMGVGDGRIFLRHALDNLLNATMIDEVSSAERPVVTLPSNTNATDGAAAPRPELRARAE